MEERIIQSQLFKVKLLNGSTISLRPLTLSERKGILKKFPTKLTDLKGLSEEQFVEKYMDLQRDVIHYIITRTNKDFTLEDVEKKIDSSIIEQIVIAILKDPFDGLVNW